MAMMSSGVTSSSTIPLLGNIIRGKFYINYDYLAQIARRDPYRGVVSIRLYMCLLRKWTDFANIWYLQPTRYERDSRERREIDTIR